MAEAFAKQAGRLIPRAFEVAASHGEASNTIKGYFERERSHSTEVDEAARRYTVLVYSFADLARLAPQYALSPCLFDEVRMVGGEHDGKVALRARDSAFFEKARKLMQDFKALRLYIHYLATWAPTEGWSMQLPDIVADDADKAWWQLAGAVYPGKTYLPGSAVHVPSEQAVALPAPWGGLQQKPSGKDAILVKETDVDDQDHHYFVFLGPDGQPDAAPWAARRSGWF